MSSARSHKNKALPVGASISLEGMLGDDTPSSDGGASSRSHAGSDTDGGERRPKRHAVEQRMKSSGNNRGPERTRAGQDEATVKGVSSVSTDEHARALPRGHSISLANGNGNHVFLSDDDSGSNSSKSGSSPDADAAGSSSDRSSSDPSGSPRDEGHAPRRSISRRVNSATASCSDSSNAPSDICLRAPRLSSSSSASAPALPIDISNSAAAARRIRNVKNAKRKGRPPGTMATSSAGVSKGDSRSRCVHGRRRYTCVACGGKGICKHKRQRYQCKECGGSGICPHDRIRSQCKDCKGGSICKHKRIRSVCVECGGGSICEHKRIRGKCVQCKDIIEGVAVPLPSSAPASEGVTSSGSASSSASSSTMSSLSIPPKRSSRKMPSTLSTASACGMTSSSPDDKGTTSARDRSDSVRAPAMALASAVASASSKRGTSSASRKPSKPVKKPTRKSNAVKRPAKRVEPNHSPVAPHAGVGPFESPARSIYMLTRTTKSYVRNNKAGGLKNVRCFPTCLDRGHNQHGFCGRSVDIRVTCDSDRLEALCGCASQGQRQGIIVAYGHFALCTDENGKSLNAVSVPPTKNSAAAAAAALAAGGTSGGASDSSTGGTEKTKKLYSDVVVSPPKSVHQVIPVPATGSVCADGKESVRQDMFTIGKSYLEVGIETLTKTNTDHSMPLYKSHVQTSWTHEHSDTSLGSTASQTENDVISLEAAARSKSADGNGARQEPSVYQVLSFSPSSWHYGWRSSKHMRRSLHVFRVYVFAVSSSSSGGRLLKCIGSVETSNFTLASSKRSKSKEHTLKSLGVKRKAKGPSATVGAKNGSKIRAEKSTAGGKTATSKRSLGAGKKSAGRSRAASEAASSLLSITSNRSVPSPRMAGSTRVPGSRVATGYSGGDSNGSSGSGSGSVSAASSSSGSVSSNSGSSNPSSSGSSGSGNSSSAGTSSDSDGNSSNSNSDESASKARDGEMGGWCRVENRKRTKGKGRRKATAKSDSQNGKHKSDRGRGNGRASSAFSDSSKKRRPKRQTSGNRKPRKSAKTSSDKSDVGDAVSGLLSMLGDA